MEDDISLGMRRYLVLLTGDRGLLPVFKRELGRYPLPDTSPADDEGMLVTRSRPTALSREEKGNGLQAQTEGLDHTGGKTIKQVRVEEEARVTE